MKIPFTQSELIFQEIKPEPPESRIYKQFEVFHNNNPEVYNNLVHLARQFRRKGSNYNRKMGIGMLYEVLRWNFFMNIDAGDECFALSNDFRACYARLIMDKEPDLQDAFNLRCSVVD
jgi:hypothetical protein